MKKYFLPIAAVAFSALSMMSCGGASNGQFSLEGTVSNPDAKMLYVYLTDSLLNMNDVPNDSIVVENGKFSYSLSLAEPKLARIQMEKVKGSLPPFFAVLPFVPGESAVLSMDPEENSFKVDGSEFYKQMRSLTDIVDSYREKAFDLQNRMMLAQIDSAATDSARQSLQAEAMQFQSSMVSDITSFIDSHKDEDGVIVGAFVMTGEFDMVFQHAGDKFKSGRFGKMFNMINEQQQKAMSEQDAMEKAAQAAQEATKEGNMFVDFECEYNGKVQKLSDYVGKGKYILVDFWASWCGPCMHEIPNIISVYNKYKGPKFDVVGVATWDDPQKSLAVIQQMDIPYNQILNAQQAGSDAYGILSIPEIILFAPDGTILKRGLRDAMIEAAVKEALKK